MNLEIVQERVVITNSAEEINKILESGEFVVRSVTPLPFSGNGIEFKGDAVNGALGISQICFVLARVRPMMH